MPDEPLVAEGLPRRRSRRRALSRAGDRKVSPERLEQLLGGGDGASTTDLAAQAGGDRARVLALLRELEAQGQVRRTGERRATLWHLITDEDRIAARAVELARQSRRRADPAVPGALSRH